MVFWAPHAEKRPKSALKNTEGKRRQDFFPQLFRPKAFDMGFPKKVLMVFLNSPC
jgi:hypothetical protein